MRPMVIGEIVHYTNLGDKDGKYPPEQNAAIVTRVKDAENMIVSLKVFYPSGLLDVSEVSYSPHYKRGYWSYPDDGVEQKS